MAHQIAIRFASGLTLRELVRLARRESLARALSGTRHDRVNYAVSRAWRQVNLELSALGSSSYYEDKVVDRARWIFERLERIAASA